ncbi:hypothetical protein [uncultured Brevundimonas sp.]|uniref:hypothetical protein n=1 Tax=uncultured Brevundimonas sp. TaxID=213418 RepID=UPI0030EC3A8D|tara:strand:+ start:3419 stop:3658 length:240 start_codon:yes stop_codon:yes gene_type:complete
MPAVRKITAILPADLLDAAQSATGAGVTETLRQGLESLKRRAFGRKLLELQGTIDFSGFDLDELREDKVYGLDQTAETE